jgi:hypothetical protein
MEFSFVGVGVRIAKGWFSNRLNKAVDPWLVKTQTARRKNKRNFETKNVMFQALQLGLQ